MKAIPVSNCENRKLREAGRFRGFLISTPIFDVASDVGTYLLVSSFGP